MRPPDNRSRTLLLSAAIGTALATLPGHHFEPWWIAAFTLPGLAALLLDSGPLRGRLGYAELIATALLLEVGLIVALFRWADHPTPEAALTYTLLAPLAYLVARRRSLDFLHALFLAFCLVLIGVILRDDVPLAQLSCFVVFSALTLQSESRHTAWTARSATRVAAARPASRVHARVAVTAGCVLASLGLFEIFGMVPSPNTRNTPSRVHQRTGLSDSFELNGRAGNPLHLVDDELVEVRTADRGAMPSELYLRTGYFDTPQAHRWFVDSQRLERTRLGSWRSHKPVRSQPQRRLSIRRLGDCDGLLFMPPGTVRLDAGPQSRIEAQTSVDMEFARERKPSGTLDYRVTYQDLGPLAGDRLTLRPPQRFTALPPHFRTDGYARLAREWTRGADVQPAAIAAAISRRLAARCTYALREPRGDSSYAIDNFLFGDRHGYCMHFATALAVLLRHNGIPCRIGVGLYAATGHVARGQLLSLGSKHAHAWVEIPLVGLGWVVFDPTPPAHRQQVPMVASTPSARSRSMICERG